MRLGLLLSWLIPLGLALFVAIALGVRLRRHVRAGSARGGQAPADLQTLLARGSEAPGRDDARAAPCDRSAPPPPDGDDLGERLLQLKALHERGLIDDADYEARKGQVLSRL